MQLNQEQIESLFAFVEKKGVKYYDVQHEIVDHLATSIESEMMATENRTFDQALQIVYGEFPITGFAQYTLDLEDSLWMFWIKKVISTITLGYGIPVIGLLAFLAFSFYYSITTNGILSINILSYGVPVLGVIAIFSFAKQFGKSGVEMLLYYGYIIPDDDLNDRLLYYKVLKYITLIMIFGPIFLARLTSMFVMDPGSDVITGGSSSILILSIFSSISIYWTLVVIFYFPKMIREVIADKYNHVVIA